MKYALLIYSDPSVEATPEEQAKVMEDYYKFTASINERGINLGGEALDGVDTATWTFTGLAQGHLRRRRRSSAASTSSTSRISTRLLRLRPNCPVPGTGR